LPVGGALPYCDCGTGEGIPGLDDAAVSVGVIVRDPVGKLLGVAN